MSERHQLQRPESVQRGHAQAVDAAHHGGIDEPASIMRCRRGKDLGAGRAGGGHHAGRPVQPERGAHVARHRIGVVRLGVVQAGRQRAGDGVAVAVGDLGLQDARGAGAQEHADPGRAVARGGAAHAVGKTVGAQAELGQAVVAAVVGGRTRVPAPCRRRRPLRRSRCRARRSRSRGAPGRCARRAAPARVAARPWPSALTSV